METGPALAILVLTGVHFAAFGLLFWHVAGREGLSLFRLGSSDEDGGIGRGDDRPPRDPRGDRDGGLPLPDAAPAPVRMREPARLADAYRRPPRRPEHAPDDPERAPTRAG